MQNHRLAKSLPFRQGNVTIAKGEAQQKK